MAVGRLEQSARQTLRSNFLFKSLNDGEVVALEQELVLETFSTGTAIVHEGDPAGVLYLVLDGGVNVMKTNGQFLAMLGAGGFFGEMGLFTDGALRSADCIAAMPTTCAVLSKATLDRFCDTHAQTGVKIYRAIIKSLAERLQATSADLAVLMGTHVKAQRDVASVVEKAKQARAKKETG